LRSFQRRDAAVEALVLHQSIAAGTLVCEYEDFVRRDAVAAPARRDDMADDRNNTTATATGFAFGLGLVAGAAIGVGLGLLFAPKSGAALRRDIAQRARDLQEEASEQYERASEAATELADRGRDIAARAKSAVATGIREARRYTADISDAAENLNN
jgi:gas vesicle protein